MMKNISKTLINLVGLFVVSSLIIGCSQTETVLNQASIANSANTSTSTTLNPTTEKSENEGIIQEPLSLESWVGDYTFTEHALPDENMYYTISIYKKDNDYFANISIDGFQTMERLLAKVLSNKGSINLVFYKYLPDNLRETYKAGDVLLSFEKRKSDLLTFWGKIQPMILDNNEPGKEYFMKEKE